jgi:AcrR family transcriptional regulator
MAKIAHGRPAAEPATAEQSVRYRRIIEAAVRIGSERGYDRVRMQEVAGAADVALGTLYRYCPSKVHLFTAVLAEQLEAFARKCPPSPPGASAEEALGDLLVHAGRRLLLQPLLANAMLQANSAAKAGVVADATRIDRTFRDMIFDVVGTSDPTPADLSLVRLVGQCWYGGLRQCLNGMVSVPDMEKGVRLAARLLLASPSATALTAP